MLLDLFSFGFQGTLSNKSNSIDETLKMGYHRKDYLNINLLKYLDLLKVSCFFPFSAIIQQWHVSL